MHVRRKKPFGFVFFLQRSRFSVPLSEKSTLSWNVAPVSTAIIICQQAWTWLRSWAFIFNGPVYTKVCMKISNVTSQNFLLYSVVFEAIGKSKEVAYTTYNLLLRSLSARKDPVNVSRQFIHVITYFATDSSKSCLNAFEGFNLKFRERIFPKIVSNLPTYYLSALKSS